MDTDDDDDRWGSNYTDPDPAHIEAWNRIFRLTLFVVLPIVVLAVISIFFPYILAALWPLLRGHMAHRGLRLLAVLTLGGLGVWLFIVRTYMRFAYGVAEIILGLVVCWATLGKQGEAGLAQGVALAGAVYIIVRGLDNCGVGIRERNK